MKIKVKTHIRLAIRADVTGIWAIEHDCFSGPLTTKDIFGFLRSRNSVGIVAECDGQIAGYLLYELGKRRIRLARMAVRRDLREGGVGYALVSYLKLKLSRDGRDRIVVMIPETNLPAQKFLRAVKFRATKVIRNAYGDEDAYRFVYRLD